MAGLSETSVISQRLKEWKAHRVLSCLGFIAQLHLKKENRVSVTQETKAEDSELYRLEYGQGGGFMSDGCGVPRVHP